ncbi:MAG: methyltransferase domain-containing protein [Ardenticatenaceae bacterium]|nr:methyltransferase domain-containing protein [Anaerolineales bacterium]MCB8922097.1 methyltransferase domain-containing protein [Ardenticatenaceae bacterium]MCB9003213.1 methyltransferase domain-containing protein [Ardenticatenaceae bacterium]
MNPVEQLYDSDPQREWERLDRHRTEFAVTWRALQAYLPLPPTAVADIGGGPGRYAIALAQAGYRVTLLDLSRGNLALAQKKAQAAGVTLAGALHGNALQLPLPPISFDAALLFGPLYHLLDLAERETAVAQTHTILKPVGLIFAAFITRFAPFRDMAAKGYGDWIINHAERAAMILQTGQNPALPGNSFPNSYFAHPDEVRPLLESQGFETLAVIGCEGVVAGHEQHINGLQGELWEEWVSLNYRLGQDPALHGAADHLLYVGRKA